MTPSAVTVSAALAGLAVACWLPGPAVMHGSGAGGRARRTALVAGPAAAVAIGCWWAADRPQVLVLVLVGSAIAGAVTRMVARRHEDRRAAVARSRVVELCDGLQAELAAGQTPIAALRRAAGEWSLLASATRTADSGGDVPTVLREVATAPGAGDLRIVAAAWQIAHHTGHGLSDAVERVAVDLRAAEHTRRIVTGELASARATARLVAVLPVVALLMGTGAGADPWSFLFGEPVGLACLTAGIGCGLAGLTWIEALARDVERGR